MLGKARGWQTHCRGERSYPDGLVARAGVEPATFHFSGERCYQLSYLAVLIVGKDG